jgi:hypothetical protein
MTMVPYRIDLHGEDGVVIDVRQIFCAHDDEAIDRAGWIDHPYAMKLWQDERLVADFPPWKPEGSKAF